MVSANGRSLQAFEVYHHERLQCLLQQVWTCGRQGSYKATQKVDEAEEIGSVAHYSVRRKVFELFHTQVTEISSQRLLFWYSVKDECVNASATSLRDRTHEIEKQWKRMDSYQSAQAFVI